jgi:glutathione peroxidase
MEKQTIYNFSAPLLDGRELCLDQFSGRVLLVVNTASKCGFTPQYAGLESLYRNYRHRGFSVLGFPSNQFGAQEPGSADEIAAFCETRFRITFPLFAKVDVNGPEAHPLYRFLKQERPGILGLIGSGAIRWNFTKFLIDRNGWVTARYGSITKPEKLAGAIERLLDKAPEPTFR